MADLCVDTSPAPVDLAGLQRLLSRRSEMDNAAVPGRHRDMDVEMASYPDNMKVESETRQPRIVANHGADTPVLTDFPVDYNARADKHQEAVAEVLREQENDTTDFDPGAPMMDDCLAAHDLFQTRPPSDRRAPIMKFRMQAAQRG